jgi:pimeloyl-ACP methyl ester carboxylesterase
MYWIYLCLIILIVLVVTFYSSSNKESLAASFHPTVVGGTTASKMTFESGHSTIIRKLLGNTNETIILLHNTPFDLQVWYPLFMYAQSLTHNQSNLPNLIAYDLLGHGTAWMPVPEKYNDINPQNRLWNYENFITELQEIYQTYIKHGKITLVGYGFGGLVASAFALQNPDLVNSLYILAAGLGPMKTTIRDELSYLVQWIAQNPAVSYLTMQHQYIRYNLCLWFENSNIQVCPYPENSDDTADTFGTVEYLLAERLYREASSQSELQMNKLVRAVDLRSQWESIQVPFSVTFLVPNEDHYLNSEQITADLKIASKASPKVNLYTVKGKHGFPLIYPEYIYKLIIGQDMSENSLTISSE